MGQGLNLGGRGRTATPAVAMVAPWLRDKGARVLRPCLTGGRSVGWPGMTWNGAWMLVVAIH